MSGNAFSWRRTGAMVVKESRQISRDPATFLIAFVLPMILLFLFGYAVSLYSSRTRVAIVLQDSSAPALRLAQAYQRSPYFEVTMARSIQPTQVVRGSPSMRFGGPYPGRSAMVELALTLWRALEPRSSVSARRSTVEMT